MEPSKSKNIYAVKIVLIYSFMYHYFLYGTLLKLTYPKFIPVFCVKYTRKFTIVLSYLARKYKLKYVYQFCK